MNAVAIWALSLAGVGLSTGVAVVAAVARRTAYGNAAERAYAARMIARYRAERRTAVKTVEDFLAAHAVCETVETWPYVACLTHRVEVRIDEHGRICADAGTKEAA